MTIEWDTRKKAYWDTEAETYLTDARVRAIAREEQAFSSEQIAAIADDYNDDLITGDQWLERTRQHIKESSIRQYAIGRGGRAQLTKGDYGVIGRRLRDQYAYLNRFFQELEVLTPNQRRARAQLYISSTIYLYERGKGRALGIPKLPVYPGDGNTPCKANCRCRWELKQLDGEGNWDATYINEEGDICGGCADRARRYAPLRIRGGKIKRIALPQAA